MAAVKPTMITRDRIMSGPVRLTEQDVRGMKEGQKDKAKYKIEVIFSRHRSSLAHKPSPLMLLIWESGKRLHGGGDQKMYWCGYDDCEKPLSSDNFAYMHVVCPHCKRELFLDPGTKADHHAAMIRDGKCAVELLSLPYVVGERLANLTPPKLVELLEKTWHSLKGSADIYLKFSPYEIRYDAETTKVIDNLDKVRLQRQPLIYLLKAIRRDIAAGSSLRARLTAMITA